MKIIILFIATALVLVSMSGCSTGSQQNADNNVQTVKKDTVKIDKGIGKFKNIALTHPLVDSMISQGSNLYDSRCISCHKLTDEKLVGPGWIGVTDRRTPEWVMNFITNTNEMLDSDIVAQQLIVTCTTRMPNQNLSDAQARAILEFMRKNDGKK